MLHLGDLLHLAAAQRAAAAPARDAGRRDGPAAAPANNVGKRAGPTDLVGVGARLLFAARAFAARIL